MLMITLVTNDQGGAGAAAGAEAGAAAGAAAAADQASGLGRMRAGAGAEEQQLGVAASTKVGSGRGGPGQVASHGAVISGKGMCDWGCQVQGCAAK